jgi:hypothetical protein
MNNMHTWVPFMVHYAVNRLHLLSALPDDLLPELAIGLADEAAEHEADATHAARLELFPLSDVLGKVNKLKGLISLRPFVVYTMY